MSRHPCADHIVTCDHCALCESGVCCAGLSAQQQGQLLALVESERDATCFREAIVAQAARARTLAEQVRIESERQLSGPSPTGSAQPLLPAAAPSAASLDPRKEVIRVFASRPNQ